MAFADTYLADRTVLRVDGDDAATFLQGLITNDIYKATGETLILALILTPQGKFLHDAFIHGSDGGYLLDVGAARADELTTLLTRYKLRAKVTIERAELQVVASESGTLADPRHAQIGYRIYVETTDASSDRTDYDTHRLTLGVPDPALDMVSGESFPLQHRMEDVQAIDYKKGCYVGQEVTARSHYRGVIRKNLFPISAEGDLPPTGTLVTANGKKVGEIRSICGPVGLALLEVEKTSEPLEAEGAMLTVAHPDWYLPAPTLSETP